MRVVEVSEGNVAGAAGYVENVLSWWGVGRGGVVAWVEGGNVVVSISIESTPNGQLLSKGRVRREERGLGLNVLPYTVPAKGHEIVHAIVRFGYAGEDAGYTLGLLRFGDGLEAEMCLAVGRVCRGRIALGGGIMTGRRVGLKRGGGCGKRSYYRARRKGLRVLRRT